MLPAEELAAAARSSCTHPSTSSGFHKRNRSAPGSTQQTMSRPSSHATRNEENTEAAWARDKDRTADEENKTGGRGGAGRRELAGERAHSSEGHQGWKPADMSTRQGRALLAWRSGD